MSATGRLFALCALFLTSGAPALIYQLAWQRALFGIYGVAMESITVVVSAFMLGLGLGSLAGGALSRRPKARPLLLFGVAEVGIAVFGWFSLDLFAAVGRHTLGAGLWATGLYSFALVVFPTMLMGATLPLLVTHLVTRWRRVGPAVGLLYFVNTLGSALACFVAALFLFEHFGMRGSVRVAAGINLVVGLGAILGGTRVSGTTATETTGPSAAGAPPLTLTAAAGLSFAAGFISLSYEIVWARVYNFVSRTTAVAFPFLLGSFLLGIALGSALGGWWCARFATRDRRRALHALGLFVVVVNVLGFLLVPVVAALVTHVWWVWTLPLVVLTAAALGATFPITSELGVSADHRAGAHTSILYVANIAGSTAGSLVTGFVLLDVLSIDAVCTLLACAGLVGGAALLAMADSTSRPRLALVLAALLVAVGLGRAPLYAQTWERLQLGTSFRADDVFTRVVESRSGVITVDAARKVYGGGAYDGVFNTNPVDDTNMIVRPYLVSAFHPAPRQVLMIGLATGSWAQVVAHHPDVERLVVVELSRSYVSLIGQQPEVQSLLDNPKVDLVFDDGRRWLHANPDERFDLVVMNTTWHWRAHASSLLSRDFLETVRPHLADGGMLYYNTTSSPEAFRTGAEVFPHSVRLLNMNLVSQSPLVPAPDRLREVLRAYVVDGSPVFAPGDPAHDKALEEVVDIVRGRLPPDDGRAMEPRPHLLARVGDAQIITDDNMGVEWRWSAWGGK